jgi:prophage antirepressor-like protein
MDDQKSQVALFEQKSIRHVWNEGEWWFSVVDVVAVLTDSERARKYWSDLKAKLNDEGFFQLSAKIGQLKILSEDGKKYLTDAANTETLLRIIQSIPSPKAEPFKQWLARMGHERLQEIRDPELAMKRMKDLYEKKGYPKDWIEKRLRGIAVRQDLTTEWAQRGAKVGLQYAILTDEIMKGTFEMGVKKYKDFKGVGKENLRDHMNDMELILTMLAEATTTKLHQAHDSRGFPELKVDAADGGKIVGRTRKDIEKHTGKPVVSRKNYLALEEGE